MGFPLPRIVRGVFQVMTVASVKLQTGERFNRRERREPERLHPPLQPRGTFRHHPQPARTGERFKVRPDVQFTMPEHLEGLQEIAAAAHVGEHAIHALGQPIPIRFGGTLPDRGGLVIDRAQRFQKLVTHFRGSARQRRGSDDH